MPTDSAPSQSGNGPDPVQKPPGTQRNRDWVATTLAVAGLSLSVLNSAQACRIDSIKRRAWVTVGSTRLVAVPKVGEILKAEVEFQSVGDAPALDVKTCARMWTFPPEQTPETMPTCDKATLSQMVLASGKSAMKYLEAGEPAQQWAIDRVTRGEHSLFVWGFAEYTDPYATKGLSQFCWVWNPGTQTFLGCSRGNWMR